MDRANSQYYFCSFLSCQQLLVHHLLHTSTKSSSRMGNEIIVESNQIREGFEKTKNSSWTMVGLKVPFLLCAVRFRESAKIAFVQAQKKLASCQKKANFEDGLVKNLERLRETLLNANQIAICNKVVLFFDFFVPKGYRPCLSCRCYTGGSSSNHGYSRAGKQCP